MNMGTNVLELASAVNVSTHGQLLWYSTISCQKWPPDLCKKLMGKGEKWRNIGPESTLSDVVLRVSEAPGHMRLGSDGSGLSRTARWHIQGNTEPG